ncbi:MAG: 2-hydroxychromene-2-carboxylate isomerase [Gammaproteobacteria bacterium]|nr:2-hydroxychromene-2-carboxylate isomerase [Gammaproteobacteria bacterium]
MPAPIEFYFDFYSPYGYLASTRIDGIAARNGREVVWRPFMLGPAFQSTGHRPLTDTPLMGDYVIRDFARCARLLGVPFQLPEVFPKAALAPARAFYWLVDDRPDTARSLARSVYHATFGEGKDGADPVLLTELAKEAGVDPAALNDAIQRPEIKSRLKTETEAAMARGVFGSPYFFVDDEPFWGHDRLDQVERWLQTGGW